jgi:hypothetical protein
MICYNEAERRIEHFRHLDAMLIRSVCAQI